MPPSGAKQKVTPNKPATAPAWLFLTLATILLLSLFSSEIRDTDIWLHLKTGQHTLESHALTVPDPYVTVASGGS